LSIEWFFAAATRVTVEKCKRRKLQTFLREQFKELPKEVDFVEEDIEMYQIIKQPINS